MEKKRIVALLLVFVVDQVTSEPVDVIDVP